MSKKKKVKLTFDPSKCISNANINDYFIYIFPDVPEKCLGGIVGYIGNYSNPGIQLDIEIDDAFMHERNHRTACFYIEYENYTHSTIVLTSSFWEDIKENEFLYATIWHEVGHFHTAQYFSAQFEGNSSRKYRETFINKGEIMPEEKAADLFALYYSSKEDIVNELNWLIKTRKALKREPYEITVKAVYEMGRRKRFLNTFNTEKEIRDELCRLCGVADFELI